MLHTPVWTCSLTRRIKHLFDDICVYLEAYAPGSWFLMTPWNAGRIKVMFIHIELWLMMNVDPFDPDPEMCINHRVDEAEFHFAAHVFHQAMLFEIIDNY